MLEDRYKLPTKYPHIRNVLDISKMTEDDFIKALLNAEGHNIVITYCYSFNDEVLRKFLGRGETVVTTYVEERFTFEKYENILQIILKQPEKKTN